MSSQIKNVFRHLSFSEVPIHYPEYPLQFPIRDYNPNDPTKSDPSFIGIFYSRCKIGELSGNEEDEYAKKRPGVYFRLVKSLKKHKSNYCYLRNQYSYNPS